MKKALCLIAIVFATTGFTSKNESINLRSILNNPKGLMRSAGDASIIGFNIDSNWTYVNDVDKEQRSLDGSSYHYGYMDSWMGIYKYYNSYDNEMYVLLLSSVESKPRKDSYWDQRRWNNRDMKTEFSCTNSSVHYLTYAPKPTVGQITTTQTITISYGMNGDDLIITTGLSYSQNYTTSEITITADGSTQNETDINYHFVAYNTNTSTNNICCSNVDRQSFAIFKITNFNPSSTYTFNINNYVSIYRYGVYNSSTVTEHQDQSFNIIGY